jgi:pantoate--beta-alanine ligase
MDLFPWFNSLKPTYKRMEIIREKLFLKSAIQAWKKAGYTLGFVPTMGALHEGHLDLVRRARQECDKVVVSIFVNPLQFNNASDLELYPRTPEADASLLTGTGADLLYLPDPASFYSGTTFTELDFGPVAAGLEGAMRPGHFSGVGIVVARLFHLVMPDKAYFGAKDLQQVAVVKTLVRDLEFPVEIVRCETRREPSGLAMSSRNTRLSTEGKALAAHLHQALLAMKNATDATSGRKTGEEYLLGFQEIKLEYLEYVDATTMEILHGPLPADRETAVCLAAWIEGVRLIDNLILPTT